MVKRGIKLAALIAAASAVIVGVILLVVIVYVQLDKTDVFYQYRGQFDRAEVIKSQEDERSVTKLLEFYNTREESVVTAYKRRPRQLQEDHFIMITYAGRGTGDEVLELIPERNDLVLISVQYPYYAPENAWDIGLLIYDVRQAGFATVGGGMLVVDYLEEAGYELDNITVAGASLGVFFGTIHGALDERVPRVLAVHGGGNYRKIWRHILDQRDEWLPRRFIVWFIDTFAGTFDPLHYVDRIAPREFVMLATRNDHYFPDDSFKQLYEQAGEPKQISWSDHGHVRTSRSEVVEAIVEEIKDYLETMRELRNQQPAGEPKFD